jgi:hypothetical protein
MDGNTAVLDQPETTFFSFDKPLSAEAERTLDLLMERYSDAEGKPLVKFETDSLVTLRIPRVIMPTYLNQRAES